VGVLLGHLRHVRSLLGELTADLDAAGPLPAPSRWVSEIEDDVLPGAVWDTGWRVQGRGEPLQVVAALEDVDDERPVVFLRGVDGDDEICCISIGQAITVGRALLAAAALAGSPSVRTRCQARVTHRTPR
jgi:hypothetical protein